MSIQNKIDFAVVFSVKNANPNGDPLNGNRPRKDYYNFGEVSDVCLKRKMRNRLQDLGETVFVQSDERRDDEYRSLTDRAKGCEGFSKALNKKDNTLVAEVACETWVDVRSFGQVFALKKGDGESGGVSLGIRGPVTIQCAKSIVPVDISTIQITKSVNSSTEKDPDKKGSDTMGQKHRVDFGIYVTYGSISPQLAEKTGFDENDAELIRQVLVSMFENDASSARPDGSMEVLKVIWWKHNCKSGQYSSAKVHRCLSVRAKSEGEEIQDISDCIIEVSSLDNLECNEYEGY